MMDCDALLVMTGRKGNCTASDAGHRSARTPSYPLPCPRAEGYEAVTPMDVSII